MLNNYTTHELLTLLNCVKMAYLCESDEHKMEEIGVWEQRIIHALSNAMFEENGTN